MLTKTAQRDDEIDQKCMLMIRPNSVLSNLQRSHLLSRERDTTRCAVPTTANSEFDDLTESASMEHCAPVLQLRLKEMS